ncbi:CoA pyrophosphatase [Bacillus sp. FJAT-49705]|uniref:CoA pyrophosphatase n=1 Tax=Cytobacillus citreus TaxID=2833586 RepID=A0ABS5NMJ6_9BACI|nr:CoA pyrophosphatase [Cytobacillus citreus]
MDIQKLVKHISNRTPTILGSKNFSKYAVLLPLVQIKGEYHILFEVRSLQLRRQPGEVCFPGGRVDHSDEDERYTAVRETSEELGITKNSIHHISQLDYMISPFGTIIYPFVGFIKNYEDIQVNPSEVEEIFTVPLSFLLQTKPEIFQVSYKIEPERDFPFHHIAGGEKYNWQLRNMEECFYYYEDKVIWGLTAKILKHFMEMIEESREDLP